MILLLITLVISLVSGQSVIECTANSCSNTVVTCPTSGEPCNVICTSLATCNASIIDCGDSTECTVTCNNTESCNYITINATKVTKYFEIITVATKTVVTTFRSKIYCPIKNNKLQNAANLNDTQFNSIDIGNYNGILPRYKGNCRITCLGPNTASCYVMDFYALRGS